MTTVRVFVRLLVAVALFFSASSSYAAAPVGVWARFGGTGQFATPDLACNDNVGLPWLYVRYEIENPAEPSSVRCYWKSGPNGTETVGSRALLQNYHCSDGSAPNDTKPWAQRCPDPCPAGPIPDESTGPGFSGVQVLGTIKGSSFCYNNCTATGVNSGNTCVTVNGQTNCFTFFSGGVKTGGECTSSTNGNSAAPSCGPGQTLGQVNGRDTCLASGSSGSPTPPTAPAATKTTTSAPTTTTTNNPDGSTTTTKRETTTETGPGGTRKTDVVTTTVTKPDGTSVTSQDKTVTGDDPNPAPDLCKANPQLNICRNSTIGGACESVTCDGDAISCAIARSTAVANCKAQAASDAIQNSAQRILGDSVMNGADPLAATLPSRGAAQIFTVPTMDNSGWLGGGACFPDKVVDVLGHSVTLRFSEACQYLIAFRYALMIVAMLVSFRMVSGTILRR